MERHAAEHNRNMARSNANAVGKPSRLVERNPAGLHKTHRARRSTMPVTLEQLTLAELRDLSRQHGLPDTYDADTMRKQLRATLTS